MTLHSVTRVSKHFPLDGRRFNNFNEQIIRTQLSLERATQYELCTRPTKRSVIDFGYWLLMRLMLLFATRASHAWRF